MAVLPRFEVFSSRTTFGRQRWRWRLIAGNGEIIAQGEGYGRRDDAVTGVAVVKAVAADAPIIDAEE